MKIFVILILLLQSCKGEETVSSRSANSSRVSQSTEDDDKDDVISTSNNDLDTIILGNEESNATEVVDTESGINILAPAGLVARNISPVLNINSIRESFGNALPGNAILLGEAKNISVKDENGTEVASQFFNDNYNVDLKIDEATLQKKSDLGVVVRSWDGDTISSTQLITQADLIVQKNPGADDGRLSFKSSGSSVDIQVVEIANRNLTETDIYYPRPKNPETVQCTAASAQSIAITWGLPGGSISAFKINYSQDENTITGDTGCSATSSISDLTGITRAYTINNLTPERTYFIRICSKNNRIPTDSSPGVVCQVTTPAPDIPTLQLGYRRVTFDSNSGLYHTQKSTGQWSLYKITGDFSNNGPNEIGMSFDLDQNDIPHISWYATSSKRLVHNYLNNGNWTIEDTLLTHSGLLSGNVYFIFSLISVDQNNTPYIIYSPSVTNYYNLLVTSKTANTWSSGNNLNGFFTSPPNGLFNDSGFLIDGNNHQHILYTQFNKLSYKKLTDGTWVNTSQDYTTVDCTNYGPPVLTQDRDGNLHGAFACRHSTDKIAYYYLKYANNTWNFNLIKISDTGNAYWGSNPFDLKIGPAGEVHFAYLDGKTVTGSFRKNNLAKFAYSSDGQNFTTETIAEVDRASECYTSSDCYLEFIKIAADHHNKTHIVFTQRGVYTNAPSTETNQIKYFQNLLGTWSEEIVESDPHVNLGGTNISSIILSNLYINGMPSRSYRP